MNKAKYPKKDAKQALIAAQKFCAYQERCHKEVRNRLYEYGLNTTDVETVLMELIESNFINEERFAIAFAGGKFRVKKWGRLKIIAELERRDISPYCIKKAIKTIDDSDYKSALYNMVEKKLRDYRKDNEFVQKKKVANFCFGKGYESALIWTVIKDCTE